MKWPKTVVQNRQGTTDLSDVVAAVKEEVEAKKKFQMKKKNCFKISSYLTTITQEMGIATRVSVSRDGNLTVFNLTSNHDALLIGKHGKILQSLQILAKAYANSILNTRMNVAVNVGDYHENGKLTL